MKLQIKVVPGASREGIAGWLGDTLKVRVIDPPEKGRANKAVERLIAAALGLTKDSVNIIQGRTSTRKVVQIDGLAETGIRQLLGKD